MWNPHSPITKSEPLDHSITHSLNSLPISRSANHSMDGALSARHQSAPIDDGGERPSHLRRDGSYQKPLTIG